MSTSSDSPNSIEVLYAIHVGVSADGPAIDAWLEARAPLLRVDPVKEVTFSRTTFLPIILEEAHATSLVPNMADADVPETART